jgi:transcriptional regulator with XRE-family HTH domain|nr:MAG TPA: helix-turn-helix domain protein [Caudoviricetes sp.]
MRSLPELVEFIRASCKNQGSSITKMEKDLKFANGTVGKWANGKRYPPKDKLLLVSDFLQISIEELMGEEQKEKPAPGEGSGLDARFDALLSQMTDADRADLLEYMEFKVAKRKENSNG